MYMKVITFRTLLIIIILFMLCPKRTVRRDATWQRLVGIPYQKGGRLLVFLVKASSRTDY